MRDLRNINELITRLLGTGGWRQRLGLPPTLNIGPYKVVFLWRQSDAPPHQPLVGVHAIHRMDGSECLVNGSWRGTPEELVLIINLLDREREYYIQLRNAVALTARF